jgi:hypothetical protein
MEQNNWNSEVPGNFVERRLARRRAEKERRARLAREMRERAGSQQAENDYPEPLAPESLPESAPVREQRQQRQQKPPLYVPPTRSIPQHHSGVSGVAFRKTRKRNLRKQRKTKSRR